MGQCPKIDGEAKYMSKVPYASSVGCLMYDMICTRPDLTQAVSQVYKFMSKAENIIGKQLLDFQYLKGTMSYGIMFRIEYGDLSVVEYSDSHYVGDMDDMRSTTNYVFTLVGGPIC
ncbi:secreted RxLR effector protein 161-like [Lathyrus oleraceus]|uniref:secreted RxLR effector protein 161-like n=1 Tax=Pisum sativum TaxID=3888 RepID=UPI0021CE10D3|nr:secreted RxLR effector protein 161-like [Pisum sativum]